MTAGGGGVTGRRIEKKGKRTHGIRQQCGKFLGEGQRGLKGNVKKYNKD